MESTIFKTNGIPNFTTIIRMFSHDVSTCLARLDEKSVIDYDSYLIAKNIVEDLGRYGAIRIRGHGLNLVDLSSAFAMSKSYFSQTKACKLETISKDKARRGYSPIGDENFGTLAASRQQLSQGRQPNDIVEKFRFGREISNDTIESDSYYQRKESRLHYYPNSWPNINEFKNIMTTFFEGMSRLATLLLSIIEIGLDEDVGFWMNNMSKHTSIASLNYYPSLSARYCSENCITDEMIAGRRVDDLNILRIAGHTDVSVGFYLLNYDS